MARPSYTLSTNASRMLYAPLNRLWRWLPSWRGVLSVKFVNGLVAEREAKRFRQLSVSLPLDAFYRARAHILQMTHAQEDASNVKNVAASEIQHSKHRVRS